MRLSLIAGATLSMLAAAQPLGAEARVASWVSRYASSDGLTVVSPRITLRAPLHHAVDLHTGYEADIISGASIDVLTAASPRGYTETRNGGHVGVAVRPAPGTTLFARFIGSIEPDYLGRTATLSAEREWLQRRLATALGVRTSFDEVGRVGDPRDRYRDVSTLALDGSAAWVFSPRTVGQISLEVQFARGYMASPYRMVRVSWPGVDLPSGVPESTPDDRRRVALAVGARHALARGWFVSTSVRVYRDSWSMMSHTEELELQRALLDDRLILGLGGRLYGQTAASFYRARYAASDGELPRYRTADKMLAPMATTLGHVRASVGLGSLGPLRGLRLTTKLELFEQRFYEFLPLSGRRAFVASLGLTTEL